MKIAIKIILAIALVCLLQRFCHKQTDGFAICKISSDLTPRKEWETTSSSIENKALKTILSQEFRYLAKGAQSYVFESHDGKYVLKFFRHSHLRDIEKLNKDFTSYKIAYELLKEQTGLVFLHLNKTEDLQQKVTIYDKLGIVHEIDIDKMEFILQKKASLIFPALTSWMESGNAEKAKQGISSLFQLLELRCQKGIFDKDPDLKTNFGFYQDKAVQIDVGRFKIYQSEEASKDEITRITDNLHHWINANYPELSNYFEEELHALH